MSFIADPAERDGLNLAARFGDLALRLTSRRADDPRLNLPRGWQLRLASPGWHGVWSRDLVRLRRLGLVLLPDPVASLGDDERQALVSDQLVQMGAGPALPDWLKPALSRAKARLAQRLAWLD